MATWRVGACALATAIAMVAPGCGTTTDDEDADEDPQQTRCVDASIGAGVLGLVERRTCDIGPSSECLEPNSGITIRFFDRNAQVGGGVAQTGTLDPDAVELGTAQSGADGTYELELALDTTYYACDVVDPDRVSCSRALQITDETPLLTVDYESGNGSLWSARACDE